MSAQKLDEFSREMASRFGKQFLVRFKANDGSRLDVNDRHERAAWWMQGILQMTHFESLQSKAIDLVVEVGPYGVSKLIDCPNPQFKEEALLTSHQAYREISQWLEENVQPLFDGKRAAEL